MNQKLPFGTFLGFLLVLLLSSPVFSQLKMESGTTNISLRLGTGFLQTSKFNENAELVVYEDFKANAPAFGAGFELALWDNIVVGADINYAKFKNDMRGVQPGAAQTGYHTYGEMSILNFILHAKYFTPFKVSKLATYARFDALPFAVFKKNATTDYSTGAQTFSNDSGIKMTYGIYAGGDWELTKNIGVFGEVGYGYTAANVGLRVTVSR